MRGFTLVEILVTVVILSILIAAIYGILNIGSMSYNEDMGLLDLQQQARLGMDGMTREIRGAKNINPEGDHITFDLFNETGIKYYLDVDDNNDDAIKNQIIREYPSGTYRILANDIASLSFSRPENEKIVEIQIEAKKPAPKRELSFSLEEKVWLRN